MSRVFKVLKLDTILGKKTNLNSDGGATSQNQHKGVN